MKLFWRCLLSGLWVQMSFWLGYGLAYLIESKHPERAAFLGVLSWLMYRTDYKEKVNV